MTKKFDNWVADSDSVPDGDLFSVRLRRGPDPAATEKRENWTPVSDSLPTEPGKLGRVVEALTGEFGYTPTIILARCWLSTAHPDYPKWYLDEATYGTPRPLEVAEVIAYWREVSAKAETLGDLPLFAQKIRCLDCDGAGYLPCPICDGEGRVPNLSGCGEEAGGWADRCEYCNSAGQVPCPSCAEHE